MTACHHFSVVPVTMSPAATTALVKAVRSASTQSAV